METILLKVKRQDDPSDLPYWEEFEVELTPEMTVLAALQAVGRAPETLEGHRTAPIVFDANCGEGICGACAMRINGKVRLACHTLVAELDEPIVCEPMESFPVVRDLIVDRDRLFDALERGRCWITLDGLEGRSVPDLWKTPAEGLDAFLGCCLCGACADACPQVNERTAFMGAALFAHVWLFNLHSHGTRERDLRLGAVAARGGVADCAGTRNCDLVCPQGIDLAGIMSRTGAAVMGAAFRSFFRG